MKKRRVGTNGPEVSAIGLGCMPMSVPAFGPIDPAEALATLNLAIDQGLNFFDTA
ncbi:MAG: aldo/keto reductase, partial [Gammaproteobacteria bacterium]|nr:aldo/keto reductase [Gammaproteobacteria bacterium]